MSWSRRCALALVLAAPTGCVSRDDLNRAVDDQVRLYDKVMGFALDSHEQSLDTQVALLRALEGDPKLPLVEAHIGTLADIEKKLERVRASRTALIEESQKLRARYSVQGE